MASRKYSDVLRENNSLEFLNANAQRLSLAILGNISVFQCADFLKNHMLHLNTFPEITLGDYDNIVQDSMKLADNDCVVIFQELCNIVNNFQSICETMSKTQLSHYHDRIVSDFNILKTNLSQTNNVIFNLFTGRPFSFGANSSAMEDMASKLNAYVMQNAPRNFLLLDIDRIFMDVSLEKAINWRDFYGSKMLYTNHFYDAYAKRCSILLASSLGKAKKALIFDCDNTLWQGIVGEDGVSELRIPPPFTEVQTLAKSLASKGIIIGLCSKNNPHDVEKVFSSHPDMVLTDEDILVREVNWNDKVTNLKSLATKCNIGIDSFVFVDDSSFECGLVREQLPEVTVVQVPEKAYQYPRVFRNIVDLFQNSASTSEDKNRLSMYRHEMRRKEAQVTYDNVEDYLRSLQLCISLFKDDKENIPRLAQMTQKTNQFNLTTKRYTENQVDQFISDDDWLAYSISVTDKYGDYGITGLSLINLDEGAATIDTFLLSCRIIGRNIEFKFIHHILSALKRFGITRVNSSYLPTIKNSQVQYFWDSLGFSLISEEDGKRFYTLILDDWSPTTIEYITLNLVSTKPN